MVPLREHETLWQYLKKQTRPIVLYGMGNGADAIFDRLARLGIPVKAVFASDEFVRGQVFRGFSVLTYAQVHAAYPDAIVLIAFASERPEILARFLPSAVSTRPMHPICPYLTMTLWYPQLGSLPMKRNLKRSMSALLTARAAAYFATS